MVGDAWWTLMIKGADARGPAYVNMPPFAWYTTNGGMAGSSTCYPRATTSPCQRMPVPDDLDYLFKPVRDQQIQDLHEQMQDLSEQNALLEELLKGANKRLAGPYTDSSALFGSSRV
eukprot:584968-Heterocapsa_arctica.AAC.1